MIAEGGVESDHAAKAQLEVLLESMEAFACTDTDYQPVLDALARRTSESLSGFCGMALASPDGAWLDAVAAFDRDERTLAFVRHVIASNRLATSSSSPAAVAFRTGTATLYPELDPAVIRDRATPDHAAEASALMFKSALAVPMRARGQTLGVMTVVRHGHESSPLCTRDLRLVQSLADHAALVITNARLLHDERRMAARLRLMSESAQLFATTTGNLDLLFELVARRLGEIVGEGCAIRMVDADGRCVEPPRAIHHDDPEQVAAARRMLQLPRPIGDGIAGHVAATGKPVLVAGIDSIGSIAAVPLRSAERIIGVVLLWRGELAPPYTRHDLQLVEEVAAHAAVAIDNARLLEAARRELAERRRAEEALARTEEQLRHAQKMEAVGRLAGGVAHDFNNLLSVVLSYSAMLMEGMPDGDPRRDDLEEIQRAGVRATELTRQLLVFSRKQLQTPRVLDLGEVVTGMENMLRRLVGEHISVVVQSAPGLGRIRADRTHIEQVIMNLAVNARDAMPAGGTLVIATTDVALRGDDPLAASELAPGRYVRLTVRDTGLGMDAPTLARVFDPFFTTKAPGKGTGLGLSTVFGIVKQSGGTITVTSEPDFGTCFEILLPCTDELDSEVSDELPVISTSGTEAILLVDDDHQVRAVARGVLRRHGYHVIEARSGDEAMQISEAHEGRLDLLITDVVMPGMNGYDLAARMAAQRPAMRVIFMSGYSEQTLSGPHAPEGRGLLLDKPLTPDRLAHAVRRALDAPST